MKTYSPTAEPKYRLIQQAIQAAMQASQLQPGARIPSERALCKTHQASLGTVQKALERLVTDGVLYRRRGSGTFVQSLTSPQGQDVPATGVGRNRTARPKGPLGSHGKTIRMGVDTNLPVHMAFWRASAKRFAERQPFVHVDMWDHQAPDANGIDFDMLECGQEIPTIHEDGSLIDLTAFSGGAIQGSDVMSTPFLAPVHMSVACMLYNRTLLEKLGCPLPTATDFHSQFEHLRRTLARAKAVLGDEHVTSCNIGPASALGGNVEVLVKLMRADGSAASARKMEPKIDQVIELRELLLHGRHRYDYNDVSVFESGHSPLFPASSARVLMLRSMVPPFEWGSHPFFSVDNAISCTPLGVGISHNTPNPLECVRFIEHLQSKEEQRHMQRVGMVPALPVDLSAILLPADRFSARSLKRFDRCLRPNRLAGKVNRYLLDSAIDAELYPATSAKAFLDRAISLGKDYLRFSAPPSGSAQILNSGNQEHGIPKHLNPS